MRLSAHLDTNIDTKLICQCGCGLGTRIEHWRPELICLFEAIRAHVQKPIFILSGWRCPRHNAAVHGSVESQHCIGAALDIYCARMNPADFADAAEYAARTHTNGQAGVGVYKEFTHVDLGLGLPPGRRWTA